MRTWVLWAVFVVLCLRLGTAFSNDVRRADELATEIPYYSDSKAVAEWAVGDIGPAGVVLLVLAIPLRRLLASAARYFRVGGHTFGPVVVWADLIGQCADVMRSANRQDQHLSSVSLRLPVMRVRGARVVRGTVSAFSRRNKPLRTHAARVVAALRFAEAELDRNPREGARELGRLTLMVSERYTLARVGSLLDDSDLREPRRVADALRLSAAAVAVAAVAVVSTRQGVPEPVAIAAAIAATAFLYQSAAAGGVAGAGVVVIELLLGAFFPGG